MGIITVSNLTQFSDKRENGKLLPLSKISGVGGKRDHVIKKILVLQTLQARVAELVDALDSKSSDSNIVRVRFPPRAQKERPTE